MSEIMSKDRSERMAKDMSERMSERYVIRKSVKRFVRKNVKRYVRKNVRRYVRKNVRRYVRQNVRKYVPSLCSYIDLDNKNSCLHQRYLVDGILFFVLFGTLQQVLLAQLCFCARRVWFGSHGGGCGGTSWDDLHWDCQSGCQRSWACVALQVDFCWCWAHVRVHGAA